MRVAVESLSYASSDRSAAHYPDSQKRNVTESLLKYLIFFAYYSRLDDLSFGFNYIPLESAF